MTINYTPTTGLAGLGGYSVSITDTAGVPYPDGTGNYAAQTRTFPIDTSFEPYRREAFRHRSIPAQREAIQMTNIMGEGTINTEGLWRREQQEWNEGAGQQYLDHRQEDSSSRFYSSKGVDVFNYPYQARLLPDVTQIVANTATNTKTVACSGYLVMGSSVSGTTTVKYYNGSTWTTILFPGSASTLSANFTDITAANTYVYIATSAGLYFAQPGTSAFTLFASGSYNMVSWANDQLIASSGNNLYAFQPRSSTANGGSLYGTAPSVTISNVGIANISASSGGHGSYGVNLKSADNNFVVGQSVNITGAQAYLTISSVSVSSSGIVTATGTAYSGMSVGEKVTASLNYGTSGSKNELVTLLSVTAGSGYDTVTWQSSVVSTATGFAGGNIVSESSKYNDAWTITSISGNTLSIANTTTSGSAPSASVYGNYSVNGYIGNNNVSDLLYTHQDPNWLWSSAVGGETQVYFAGYSRRSNSGVITNSNGCIYRSDLLGSSTTTASGIQTVSTSTVAQPFQLVTPVQALPMSPDEYPTVIQSYLNFIFIGTNRGIRMAQTLSVYDPTATATGDLKSGPLIPNILTPLTYPVTDIIGDGRFVWFAWNDYDNSITPGTHISTGLGKLDLTTFINGDPLAPVYASDLMVSYSGSYNFNTGAGMVNSIAWDSVKNLPVITVGGLGVYEPLATNVNGRIAATQYVPSGTLTTSIFDYGIPDQKAPVYFEYGGVTPTGTTLQANVICEPQESFKQTIAVSAFTSPTAIGTATKEYAVGSNPKSSQFQVVMTLNAATITTTYDSSPTMYRWTLKSFPNVVSGTNISLVLQLFSVDVVDGVEVYMDPYDNFYWLESLRQAQNLVTYQEGPLSASIAIIESLDWIPHKRRDNYENGYEGDCVVTIKTLGPYSYNKPNTN